MSKSTGRMLIDQGLALYREGARLRLVQSGVNANPASINKFEAAHRMWLDLSTDKRLTAIERAEARHHAASAAAPGNANMANSQGRCNTQALQMLNAIPSGSRGTGWQQLHDKINAGLMENGHKPFNIREYQQIVTRQLNNGLKDGPGRAAFLINKLNESGQIAEAKRLAAIAKKHLEREDTNFADNQVERLKAIIVAILEIEDDTTEGADEEDDSDDDHPGAPSTGPPNLLRTGFHFIRFGNHTLNVQYN